MTTERTYYLFKMLNSFRPKSNCEEEAKFLHDRIQLVEKHLADICDTFGQYARKAARIRDKGDEVAKSVLAYSSNESINKSLSVGLENFADCVSTLSDYGDARTQALEMRVVGELSRYEDICKRAREEVKDIFAAREREVQRKRQLDRIRDRNPRNRQQISQAETELVKATAELSKTVHHIEEKASTFERQKLHDVKSVLLDFISIEMGYHARALEVLTKAYASVDGIDESADLEEFKKSLRLPGTIHRHSPGPRSSLFRSTQSLGSLGAIFSSSHNKKIPGITHSKERLNKSEETLDSMKHEMPDSMDELSDSVEESSSEDKSEDSQPVRRKPHKKGTK
ncbi:CBY1-interacting BAR domain-containing protein 1 [Anthonomus grandis grandis]|uniref:CBY1-interacting BAR domain-containing protein 1 n=1 Tax=Anthonomus grandis grandis TaxID=2921223 RepID=UPI0021661A21|nr:CBY1-interacting BAR domain-containing protein 1 [Anthonomus grandis grandis]